MIAHEVLLTRLCFSQNSLRVSTPQNPNLIWLTGKWTPLLTSILVVWCVKLLSAILKYVKYSAVLENSFPASQQRLEVFRGVHLV